MKCVAGLRAPLCPWGTFSSSKWIAFRAASAPSSCGFPSKLSFSSPVSCGSKRCWISSPSKGPSEVLPGGESNLKKTYSLKGMNGFTDVNYNKAADAFLENLEIVLDELESDEIKDINLSDGVLTIETSQGTFLFNKQAPNLQMWLSSPISGPHHYNMVKVEEGNSSTDEKMKDHAKRVRWVCERDGHDLEEMVSKELWGVLGVKLVL